MQKRRVLVVDDYPGARYRRMRILLDDGGFEVSEEMMGRDAVRKAVTEPIDLVLVDLHLPDITGLDVCKAIKDNPATRAMPVILISAVSETKEATKLAEKAGAYCFLPDTVDADTLLKTVRAAIDATPAA